MLDGKKFYENKTHLKLLRKVSDELCYKYGLSVIEKDNATKYYPLDQSTLNAAKEGRSWKFQLVKDLDKAFENCHSKNEFIIFFHRQAAINSADNEGNKSSGADANASP